MDLIYSQQQTIEKETIRVLIVDDIPQVRRGLATVLDLATKNLRPRIVVVGEAENGHEAILQAELLQPDVVLMDLEMPVLDGCSATQSIKSSHPTISVIILTIHSDPAGRSRAIQAGADAFIAKGAPLNELVQAIQKNQGSH